MLGIISFLTSTVTAIVGLGGGMMLIAAMPGFVPLAALIPVHGVVQLASNFSRAIIRLESVERKLFMQFVAGAFIGAALGRFALPYFQWDLLPFVLGGLIIVLAWAPKGKIGLNLPGKFYGLGAFQTFLAMFVGIAGPLTTAFLVREDLTKDQIVVTHAAQVTFVHLFKVIVFALAGFAYSDYFEILIFMVLGAFSGSIFGTRIRSRVPERGFMIFLKILLTVLGIRMVVLAIS